MLPTRDAALEWVRIIQNAISGVPNVWDADRELKRQKAAAMKKQQGGVKSPPVAGRQAPMPMPTQLTSANPGAPAAPGFASGMSGRTADAQSSDGEPLPSREDAGDRAQFDPPALPAARKPTPHASWDADFELNRRRQEQDPQMLQVAGEVGSETAEELRARFEAAKQLQQNGESSNTINLLQRVLRDQEQQLGRYV